MYSPITHQEYQSLRIFAQRIGWRDMRRVVRAIQRLAARGHEEPRRSLFGIITRRYAANPGEI